MNDQYIDLLQKMIANISVGPSTARGMSPKGTISKARLFLCNIDLSRFRVKSETSFRKLLDGTTAEFVSFLPRGARRWGSARKFLNIFLRFIVYDSFLCKRYELKRIEPWLELPLDSHVANGLRNENGGRDLPRWKTIVGLQPETSDLYQTFAKLVARKRGTQRIHLDLLYWRSDSLDPCAFAVGDKIRVVKIPPNLTDSAKIGTPAVFKRALGKTFRVMGFGRYGHLELEVTKRDTIWIEPEFVVQVGKRGVIR